MAFPDDRLDGRAPQDRRYGAKPSPSAGGSNERLGGYPARPAVERAELTDLLGRSVLEARTQRICRAYGLRARTGGLSRCYLARSAGLELAADPAGVVTTLFVYLAGEEGFEPYRGELPGDAGSVPRRAALWAVLGRPDSSGPPHHDPVLGDFGPWDRWLRSDWVLHAQYAQDGQNVRRLTYAVPDTQRAA